MKWSVLLVTVPSVFLCQAALPLPPYIKPCARSEPNFNECALEHAKDVFPQMIKGDKRYHIPPLDPLDVKEITLVDGGVRSAALHLVLKNAKVYGLKNCQIDKTEYDFDKQHIGHEVSVPKIDITGQYTVSGRFLLLPISGNGDVNVTLVNCKIRYEEDYTFRYIEGLRHLDPQNPKTRLVVSRMYFNLTNLFNGDPVLNKQMSTFLNENWRDLYNEISPSLFSVWSQIIFKIFTDFDKLVPFDVVFPENLPE